MAIMLDPVDHASSLVQEGRLPEARDAIARILAGSPSNAPALHLAGVIELLCGAPQAAIPFLSRCVEIAPAAAFAWSNLGVAYNGTGDFTDALACFEKSLGLQPGNAVALKNRGIALRGLRRPDEAMASLRSAAQRAPNDAEIHLEVANVLVDLGRPAEALARYDRALALAPNDAKAHHNRGFAGYLCGKLERAAADVRRALELSPRFARAHSTLGVVLKDLGRARQAVECHARAVEIEPDNAQFHNNLGVALDAIGRREEAIASYDRALALAPDYAEAWENRGAALDDLKLYARALGDYERAAALAPGLPHNLGHRVHIKMHLCDWQGLDDLIGELRAALAAGEPASVPFALLSLPVALELQRACARMYASHLLRRAPAAKWDGGRYRHERIRVGYFSASFHNHPVAYLVAPLVENHDRARFEVIAFSLGPDTGDPTRERLERAFDRFEDMHGLGEAEIVERARALELDIAIDLMGFTEDARITALFARRPAPVQAQYLGYAGTMGTACIDYVLADAIVVPEEHLPLYDEKVAYLPGSYQVNDAARPIASSSASRLALGLPAGGFVFCCFCNPAKITPQAFDVWMRLLGKVPDSVLWLVQAGEAAPANLRAEARRRGIAAERLVFAPRVPLDEHLARAREADLFLDTFPYNGHATTSDTLLAGVPVVTLLGTTFAGRVSASLLHAVGLPELIADTLEEYEAIALGLASDRAALRAVREKLCRNRATHPLFDAPRFVRNLEAVYERMVERQQAGLAPDHLRT